MSLTLDEVTLVVPELWDKPWEDYIADAEGLDREFLRALYRYVQILRGIASKPVTPAKIGFLSLWSRLIGSLIGARGASTWESRFAVSVLSRVALEASLHLQAIMLPVLERQGTSEVDAYSEVRARLAAYVVWTLRSDQLMYRDLLSEKNLQATFDRKLERDLATEMGESTEEWERLTHQRLEIVSDQEAAFDRERAREYYERRLTQIELWLADDRLRLWRQKLVGLETAKKTGGAITLFSLLGLKDSVAAFARHRGGPLGYFSYSRGSGFIHGSSLEASMMIDGLVMAPDFVSFSDEFAKCAASVLRNAGLAGILLGLLAGRINEPAV